MLNPRGNFPTPFQYLFKKQIQNGQAHQEPLGASHHHDGGNLYVHFSTVYILVLLLLTHYTDQVAAAIEGFFWPKIFWDFLSKNLDGAVKPIPILQIINLFFGIGMLALEWPLSFVAGTGIHRSLEFRLIILPLTTLTSALMYQSTNPAIDYFIGIVLYFCAYSEC